jgi:cyclic pyranopterin phosphate synthase
MLMAQDETELTHLDAQGRLRMVDVTEKDITAREARAEATVYMSPDTLRRICDGSIPKGNVFEVARVAGIMAAKRTWELIPLCHSLQLTGVEIDFIVDRQKSSVRVTSRVRTTDRTGVEMEALVAVTHACLTIYDMCKAIDREIRFESIRLNYKSGGRSGMYERSKNET